MTELTENHRHHVFTNPDSGIGDTKLYAASIGKELPPEGGAMEMTWAKGEK